jgi:hypothetical protein
MSKKKLFVKYELTQVQRKLLSDLWFKFGNSGPKHTHAGHRFIQCLLEHGEDCRDFFKPPKEVIEAVDPVLAMTEMSEADALLIVANSCFNEIPSKRVHYIGLLKTTYDVAALIDAYTRKKYRKNSQELIGEALKQLKKDKK